MTSPKPDPGQLLRARGLRSTPQRRAILGAFAGGDAEHLSADEVFARAAKSVPDLSRATVYATLAEFTEAGLLGAIGSPEPVRYETNTEAHAHFRCRLCLRIFDVAAVSADVGALEEAGYAVERVEFRSQGVCAECADYAAALRGGARAIARRRKSSPALDLAGAGAAAVDSPIGQLLLVATPAGIARVAFPEHGDAGAIRAGAGKPTGRAATGHLRRAAEAIDRYFAGAPTAGECEIDWHAVGGLEAPLRASAAVGWGERRSYSDLGAALPARELGRALGANPVPVLIPCHRVMRGVEVPADYVGGAERRAWLLGHEEAGAGR